jgi:hypothetical protein
MAFGIDFASNVPILKVFRPLQRHLAADFDENISMHLVMLIVKRDPSFIEIG